MDPLSMIVFELANYLLALDTNALVFVAKELESRAGALRRAFAAVGEVDGAIAIASWRSGTGRWTRPLFRPGNASVEIEELGHPLLPAGVTNTVRLAPPHGALVTGSNMSGKSTFLRSLGVAVIMSGTVNTCTARGYVCPNLRVKSCMGRSDNLIEGRSYYLDEVQGILGLVRASQSDGRHLFLLDELFRGTNAVERIAAAEATLAELAQGSTPHVVVAATHDLELVTLLTPTFTTFHFSDQTGADGLVFDYHLTEGPSTSRNALALLESYGAPSTLIKRAIALAERLDRERLV